jgi:hypothetical protein
MFPILHVTHVKIRSAIASLFAEVFPCIRLARLSDPIIWPIYEPVEVIGLRRILNVENRIAKYEQRKKLGLPGFHGCPPQADR